MLKRWKESDIYLATDSTHRRSPQIMMKVEKATHFIHFHRNLRTPAMSTVSSQVGVALFPSF